MTTTHSTLAALIVEENDRADRAQADRQRGRNEPEHLGQARLLAATREIAEYNARNPHPQTIKRRARKAKQ
ncbi:hypothetical protein SEA_ABBA_41 [Arthrobacter phage Abba]|uniref:Uncharacterized protein n=1 Tax=Arthrobacter phage Abba TaxID=2713256 RepID=A0A6G8R2E0_9CAUD|nr:hypothetical protein HYQ28_gp41 [Arthrobacter phage Abba]QIN94370.1 hypothetical protein SEA_ABBA_41 [Arthrobacter phage Abba]